QGHEPVAETADHRRHDHEEDHDQGVSGHHDVVAVLGAFDDPQLGDQAVRLEDLDAGLRQLPADQAGQQRAYDPRHDGEQDVERADVLVVGGEHPADKEARLAIVTGTVVTVVVSVGAVGHLTRVLDFSASPAPGARACWRALEPPDSGWSGRRARRRRPACWSRPRRSPWRRWRSASAPAWRSSWKPPRRRSRPG